MIKTETRKDGLENLLENLAPFWDPARGHESRSTTMISMMRTSSSGGCFFAAVVESSHMNI